MRIRKISIASLASFACLGCATHPLPEDVTPFDTAGIVRNIRCEARDGIQTALARYLQAQSDEATREQGNALRSGRITVKDLDLNRLNSEARHNISKYVPAAIAYDFTFDIIVDNTSGGQLDFLNPFTDGLFTLGLKADGNLQRQTVRVFRISDTFGNLLGATNCPSAEATRNRMYPIAGTIGLSEVITTFVDLNEFHHLSGTKEKETVPVLADTFNFQTIISGSVFPKVVLTPIGDDFQLADASYTAGSLRKDIHRVIVALSLPPTKAPTPSELSAIFGPGFRPTSLSSGKTPAELRAIEELDNQITRSILTGLVVRPN